MAVQRKSTKIRERRECEKVEGVIVEKGEIWELWNPQGKQPDIKELKIIHVAKLFGRCGGRGNLNKHLLNITGWREGRTGVGMGVGLENWGIPFFCL
jgi:hypothetical protein